MSDWFERAATENERLESERSSPWPNALPPEGNLQGLRRIRDRARILARIQGVSPQCRIDLAGLGDAGAGAAGFADAPNSFERPFILIDTAIAQSFEFDKALVISSGVVLHESGHILYTREGYRRGAKLSSQRRNYENLLEDERIEQLLRQDSPGYAGLLQSAKYWLLQQGEPGTVLQNWEALADLDRVNALIFAFIRLPHLLKRHPEIQNWRLINGECLFQTLRDLLPAPPETEQDVADFAQCLETLVDRLRALYPESAASAETTPTADEESLSSEMAERLARQLAADAEDRATAESPDQDTVSVRLSEESRDLSDAAEGVSSSELKQALQRAAGQLRAQADLVGSRTVLVETMRKGRRFATSEVEQVLSEHSVIRQPLNAQESETLRRADQLSGEVTEGEAWESQYRRRTVIERPVASAADRLRYQKAAEAVQDHVSALRRILSVRQPSRRRTIHDLKQGQLDPRRLAKATFSERVFARDQIQPTSGLAVCLVLDASGSMSKGHPSREAVALEATVLLMEAMRSIPRAEVEVYSHSSTGPRKRDCLVRCLFGHQAPDPHTVGGYRGHGENYDHQAILTIGKLFQRQTTGPQRWMIVLSDGSPYGTDYGGPSAIQATKAAVDKLRREGLKVVNIAIADFQSEAMFGEDWVIKLNDLRTLVPELRKLLVRLLRGSR